MMRKARGFFFLAFYFKPFYLPEWFDEQIEPLEQFTNARTGVISLIQILPLLVIACLRLRCLVRACALFM